MSSIMHTLSSRQVLPVYSLQAHNYAENSENKIHGDEIARKYGFSGGLVPGIGVYAYMTHPVVDALGLQWLGSGAAEVKFIKPLYHGDRVDVSSRVIEAHPLNLEIQVHDSSGNLCATGNAWLQENPSPPDPKDYPLVPASPPDHLWEPSISSLRPGTQLGSLELKLDMDLAQRTFVPDVREKLPIYFGSNAACHPALLLAQANYILRNSVNLGPWIHTASEVHNYAIPKDGELLSLRGSIREAYEKKGREFVSLDLAMFGMDDRPLAKIIHQAIIRL